MFPVHNRYWINRDKWFMSDGVIITSRQHESGNACITADWQQHEGDQSSKEIVSSHQKQSNQRSK